MKSPGEIKRILALQLSSPIQWESSIRRMIDDGITSFIEIGPGKVIASLMRRICQEAEISSTDKMME